MGTTQQAKKHPPISMPIKDLDKTSSSNPTLALLKERRKGKKKEKESQGKSKKATTFADFCVDMGGNSPIPNKQ